MAVFTTADRDAVKSALITAATTGFASVSISGHAVQSFTLDQLRALLKEIQADLAGSSATGGMRITQLTPGGCG